VPTDTVSIAIDLGATCFFAFVVSTPFCRASLRRDKIGGVLMAKTPVARLLAWLYGRPVLMCTALGILTVLILFALTAPLFALLNVTSLPFYLYTALKSVFAAGLGVYVTCIVLYGGMSKIEA
jgi:CBS domain containing-hemolysin-like protein